MNQRTYNHWHMLSLTLTYAGMILSLMGFIPTLHAESTGKSAANFDSGGNLLQPADYREWIHVGTPVTPNDLNPPKAGFPEFHNVYIDPDSWAHWKKTGTFRDGTILVKELISVGAKQASSGKGYFMGEFIGLEATVKDAKRFAKEPGNWGYFTFSHAPPPYPAKAKMQPTAACNGACHEKLSADDWVFTQYYPVLRATKGK